MLSALRQESTRIILTFRYIFCSFSGSSDLSANRKTANINVKMEFISHECYRLNHTSTAKIRTVNLGQLACRCNQFRQHFALQMIQQQHLQQQVPPNQSAASIQLVVNGIVTKPLMPNVDAVNDIAHQIQHFGS